MQNNKWLVRSNGKRVIIEWIIGLPQVLNDLITDSIGESRIVAWTPLKDHVPRDGWNWQLMQANYPFEQDLKLARQYVDLIDWNVVFIHMVRGDTRWLDLLCICRSHINYGKAPRALFEEPYLSKIIHEVNIPHILIYYLLDEDSMLKHAEVLLEHPYHISKCQNLYDSFVDKYHDRLEWNTICSREDLSGEFIRKWINKFNLQKLFEARKLPTDIIRRYRYSIHNGSTLIPRWQILEEDEIMDGINFYDWQVVCRNQKMSLEFLLKVPHEIPIAFIRSNSYYIVETTGLLTFITLCDTSLIDAIGYGKCLLLDNQSGRRKIV